MNKEIIKYVAVAGVVLALVCGINYFTNDDKKIITQENLNLITEEDGERNELMEMHESWDADSDGINDCEKDGTCDHTIDYSQIKKEVDEDEEEGEVLIKNDTPDLYQSLKVLSEKEFEIEISRSLKDCVGTGPQKCMQVKPENEEWRLYYDSIYGFDYNEGDYYVLKVKETQYDFSDLEKVPAGVSSSTWGLIEILKHVGPIKQN